MSSGIVKDFFREIKNNIGRFLSIFFIVALGTAFFSGLRSAGGDMRYSADCYYDDMDLMDIRVIGTLGLTDEDLSDIREVPGVEVAYGGYSKDVICLTDKAEYVLHCVGYKEEINRPYIIEGRLPKNKNECLVDGGLFSGEGFNLGDEIVISSGDRDEDIEDSFNTTKFKVVGKGYMPYYTDISRGSSSIGDGHLDAFLLLDEAAFDMDVFTEIYVSVSGAKETLNLSDEYQDIVDPVREDIEALGKRVAGRRYDEVYADGMEEIESSQKEVDDGWRELKDAEDEIAKGEGDLASARRSIADNEAKLASGQAEYDAGLAQYNAGLAQLEAAQAQALAAYGQLPPEMEAEFAAKQAVLDATGAQLEAARVRLEDSARQLNDARSQLATGERELSDAKREYDDAYEDAVADLLDGQKKIDDGRQELDSLKESKWYVLDRELTQGVIAYDQNSDRMDSLSNVFPVIFFLVAALVSLTAMTRMVDEQRIQIGSLKALGYSSGVIAGRYFWYAMLATITGSIVGVLAGEYFLPWVIARAYGILFISMPYIYTPINWGEGLLALICAAGSTGIATLGACIGQLRTVPAALMRPVAPKGGKRIFLERVPLIWNRLKFNRKSSLRNLFRYKKRFIMTVIGVGGCMALLLVGFGLKDSIQELAKEQFINIFKYKAQITVDMSASDEDKKALDELINSREDILASEVVFTPTVDLVNGKKILEANLFVPTDAEGMDAFLNIRNRETREAYDYPKTGAIITEKTATMLEAQVGDAITIRNGDDEAEIEITRIMENYIRHYLFISEETYKGLFGKDPEYDTYWITYEDKSPEEENVLGKDIMEQKACSGISFVSDLEREIDEMLSALDMIVLVLIVAAGLLAFIVLYNLNSINILERRRELATLKVLGFYDGEVSMYIFRENIILTVIGILLGLVFGTILHRFTIVTVEVDLMMFGRYVSLFSYLVSSGITLGFSLLINVFMHGVLRKIDMVESLKSVE